jgi:hypothetical protein
VLTRGFSMSSINGQKKISKTKMKTYLTVVLFPTYRYSAYSKTDKCYNNDLGIVNEYIIPKSRLTNYNLNIDNFIGLTVLKSPY